MDEEIFFSILIPSYKAKRYLKDCLDTCFNQTYKNFEIILCDNASNDGTIQLLQTLKRDNFKYFIGTKVNSRISVRNFLINQAKGKYIIWLQPYDKLSPDLLKSAYEELIIKDYDILEFSTVWCHNNNKSDIGNINEINYESNSCIEIYMNRNDSMQDVLWGKVIKTNLMKKILPSQQINISCYEELFYVIPLFYYAKSYKSIKSLLSYMYYCDIDRYDGLLMESLKRVKTLINLKNQILNYNLNFLRQKNINNKQYDLICLYRLNLFGLFQEMMSIQFSWQRKEAFQQFYKYFSLQLWANNMENLQNE